MGGWERANGRHPLLFEQGGSTLPVSILDGYTRARAGCHGTERVSILRLRRRLPPPPPRVPAALAAARFGSVPRRGRNDGPRAGGRGRLTSSPGRVPKGDGWELRSGDRSASSPPHPVRTTATVSGHRGTGRGGLGAVRHGDPGARPIGPRGPRSKRLGLPGHTVSAVLHSRQRAGSAHSRMTMRIGQFWSHLRGRAGSGLFAD